MSYLDSLSGHSAGIVSNSAGGDSYKLDLWGRILRFLVLGTDAPTYYANAKELTSAALSWLDEAVRLDGPRLVNLIAAVSTEGRAARNDAAILALAYVCATSTGLTRAVAEAAVSSVVRTGTHLFQFVAAIHVCGKRGWNRAKRRAVAQWYYRGGGELAWQVIKYPSRGGWSHQDVIRLIHLDGTKGDAWWRALIGYIAQPAINNDPATLPVALWLQLDVWNAFAAEGSAGVCRALESADEDGIGLPWEALPTPCLGAPQVWQTLIRLHGLPLTAMMRNLGRMAQNGALDDVETRKAVAARLVEVPLLKAARAHPLSVLVALNTYAAGTGVRGSGTWTPHADIVDALDNAFYLSFGAVQGTGKRILLALDVSGSMAMTEVAGMTGITPRVGSAAMALITLAAEKAAGGTVDVVAFTAEAPGEWHRLSLTPLTLSPRQRLDDVIQSIANLDVGYTDCALPIKWAQQRGALYDAFVVYTDNEHYAGPDTPAVALRKYRATLVANAKLIVVAMTATKFTVADPTDRGMLDVVGFDTAAPGLISSFIAGLE